jgi:RNA-binding proteins (RRM domain)
MLQTFAASLFRSLSAPACALRQVHSRYDEAEFPSASQSAWNEFDSALDESRATDGVPSLFGALRPFDNWKTVKDQHELLFIRKTPTPPARWGPRRGNQERFRGPQEPAKTQKKTFWQRVAEFFGNGGEKKKAPAQPRNGTQPSRPARKPERVEVTSPRLYVGNLSFDATESDLFDLFNGVGHVQNAEVVSYRHNQRSKGFAFVQMQTVEEAKRAVEELHDKEFLGRRLVVSGAKSDQHQPH